MCHTKFCIVKYKRLINKKRTKNKGFHCMRTALSNKKNMAYDIYIFIHVEK